MARWISDSWVFGGWLMCLVGIMSVVVVSRPESRKDIGMEPVKSDK